MIDSTATVDPGAKIADGVRVGPHSIIGDGVHIGEGSVIGAHVLIEGPTRIGRDNRIHSYASLGAGPQDTSYDGEPTRLEVGDGNTIGEFCTVNRGTPRGGGITRVGNDNRLMAYVHIAHDCIVGDGIRFGNAASLAGHVVVEDHALLERVALVHQFCQVGTHSRCCVGSRINCDVPPYVIVSGKMARPRGINTEGLRRRGFDPARITRIREAYRVLYRSGLDLDEAIRSLEAAAGNDADLSTLVAFIRGSRRSIMR